MKDEKVKVYVWEFPVRFTHWINVLCLLALSVTGFYVGNPFIYAQSSEQYIMGWIRFIHFVAAYTFLMSIIIRIYWFIVGNKYASISEWLPVTGKRLGEMMEDLARFLIRGSGYTCPRASPVLGKIFPFFYINTSKRVPGRVLFGGYNRSRRLVT